ncbi:MAG: MarR family EPS-associated transcriptional regulator [Chloroflexi bacterium]|nr:MarR family EPS-associated transcriptional regulator [Chloroflexota bacterium]|tara:strand:+ start:4834 stop:5148 length:315 start_codon:yes stop_codon:yes gene_type:complete
MNDQDYEYRVLRIYEEDPNLTQREISAMLGLSLGKTNYIIKGLIDKGFLKLSNFRDSNNKKSYIYILTPKAISERALLTKNFLKRRSEEYNELKKEIKKLKKEL